MSTLGYNYVIIKATLSDGSVLFANVYSEAVQNLNDFKNSEISLFRKYLFPTNADYEIVESGRINQITDLPKPQIFNSAFFTRDR